VTFVFVFRPKMNVRFRFVFGCKWNFIFVDGHKWKMLFGRPLVYITKRSWSWDAKFWSWTLGLVLVLKLRSWSWKCLDYITVRKTKIGTEVVHVTHDSDTTFKVKGQHVADVLNSQHARTGTTWRINAKTLSTCRGLRHNVSPCAQLV